MDTATTITSTMTTPKNSRRSAAAKAIYAQGGKGERGKTPPLPMSPDFIMPIVYPPPPDDTFPTSAMLGVRRTGGGGAKMNTKEELK